MPFVLGGIWAYKLTSLLEGDEDGRSGGAGRSRAETRRDGMKTHRDANWQRCWWRGGVGTRPFDLNFDFLTVVRVPSANMGGDGVRDLCCSQPPGGDQDPLVVLLSSLRQRVNIWLMDI